MGYRDRPRLTPESFQALYGGRHRKAITEAIRGHLVDGLSLARACKLTGASRSGVYKAMEKTGGLTPVQSSFLVHCPVHRLDTLRGLVDRQLSIWAKADADALAAHTEQPTTTEAPIVEGEPGTPVDPQATEPQPDQTSAVPGEHHSPATTEAQA